MERWCAHPFPVKLPIAPSWSEHFARAAFCSSRDFLHKLVRPFSVAVYDTVKALTPDSESVPNFILAFIPAQINTDTLNTMTAFAVRASLAVGWA